MTTATAKSALQTVNDAISDINEAAFNLGMLMGTLSKYRKDYPERVGHVHQKILQYMPKQAIEAFYGSMAYPAPATAMLISGKIQDGLENIRRPEEHDPYFSFWQHGRAYTIVVDQARTLHEQNGKLGLALNFLRHNPTDPKALDLAHKTLLGRADELASDPTVAMIDAVLAAQEQATFFYVRQTPSHPSGAPWEVCRLMQEPNGDQEVVVIDRYSTRQKAEDRWRRAKAEHVARAILATPTATMEPAA